MSVQRICDAVVPAIISAACRCGTAVLVPMSVQRICDAVVPAIISAACCGDIAVLMPHLYRHPAMLPAPQGSHYSITAGERSEPAEGACPHHHRPQGGRTLVVCGCPALSSLRVAALRLPVCPLWGRAASLRWGYSVALWDFSVGDGLSIFAFLRYFIFLHYLCPSKGTDIWAITSYTTTLYFARRAAYQPLP